MKRRLSVRDRFLKKIIVEPDSCWIWTGTTLANGGYGYMSIGKTQRGAHRLSWEHFCGSIPNELCVLHKCDVRICVNPDHLFLGTDADNMTDKKNKGRARNGENKLTREEAMEIRSSTIKNCHLARKYGVTPGLIGHIKRGRCWK
jgi:hypothetical protein